MKFPPAGGKLREGGADLVYGYTGKTQVSGALWVHGVSQVPLHGEMGAGGAHYCSCEQIRFDVDGFGRVFSPDTVRFQVLVLDTAGNLIGRFGNYGNVDSQLTGGTALRFVWPEFVLASDAAVYVGDPVSRSILRAAVTYAAEEIVPVP